MNNIVNALQRFLKNKNTVTIIGVVLILVLLYVGYSAQINNAVEPVTVPVATETIQPRTEITEDMVTTVDMPAVSVSDNVITSTSSIVGKYSNVNTVIPEGSMFYTDTVVDESELPDSVFVKVKDGEIVYNMEVDTETTFGNSIYPGNIIDIWMKTGDGNDEKVMIGKLVENVEVLAVKDSSGKDVFENTDEDRTPSMMIFGLPTDAYNLVTKAKYLENIGVELYPVPHGGTVSSTGEATEVSTQELVDYIEAYSVNIVTTEEETEQSVVTYEETGGNPNTVTITYPTECSDGTYTCTYSKNNKSAKTITEITQSVKFTSTGTLTITVIDSDGNVLYNGTIDVTVSEE